MTGIPQHAVGTKVLFVSGLQIHPTRSGGNLRSFALVNALRRRGCDVFVYSLVGRKNEYLARRPSSIERWPEGTLEYVDRRALGFVAQFGSYALGLPPLWLTAALRGAAASPGERFLPARLRERLAWCDAVVADFPFVYPVLNAAAARGRRRILSTHNLEHQRHAAQHGGLSRWLRLAVRRLELRAAAACDVLVTCCSHDQEFFEAHARPRHQVLVPNGVDLARFHGFEAHRASVRQGLGIADDVKVFLFTASKYGPNQEAFDFLVRFAHDKASFLAEHKIHILVVGNVTKRRLQLTGFSATGPVDVVEPYFAAADAALNAVSSGAGTNVKMCEFIATRLPIVTTRFGARGLVLEDGRTAFLFEKEELAPVLEAVGRLFDQQPGRLRQMADAAYVQNESAIDMDLCVQPLAEALGCPPPAARSEWGRRPLVAIGATRSTAASDARE
jgi:glycosyltransferase involved in cell wall biosynthesis